LKRRQRTRR